MMTVADWLQLQRRTRIASAALVLALVFSILGIGVMAGCRQAGSQLSVQGTSRETDPSKSESKSNVVLDNQSSDRSASGLVDKLLEHYPINILPIFRGKEIISSAYMHFEAEPSVLGPDFHLVTYRSDAPGSEIHDHYRSLLTRLDDRSADSKTGLSGWIGNWPVEVHVQHESDKTVQVILGIGWDKPDANQQKIYFNSLPESPFTPITPNRILSRSYEVNFSDTPYRQLVTRYETTSTPDAVSAFHREKLQALPDYSEQHGANDFSVFGWQDADCRNNLFYRPADSGKPLVITWSRTS